MNEIINKLEKILEERKNKEACDSYVSGLYQKGNKHICDKVLEEAKELIDATDDCEKQIIHESADLLFHVLVLLASHDIKYATILEELTRRFGTSGIVEKNNRNK
tara:strand:+ start:7906 stop:8220 length:315 start_codon:yes stop_codon:yes gene_type:complete